MCTPGRDLEAALRWAFFLSFHHLGILGSITEDAVEEPRVEMERLERPFRDEREISWRDERSWRSEREMLSEEVDRPLLRRS